MVFGKCGQVWRCSGCVETRLCCLSAIILFYWMWRLFAGVCSTRNVFTHLGRNWPCSNISSSCCFLPSLNCLLHVLLRPEFSLGNVRQEEGEREILDVKEAPWWLHCRLAVSPYVSGLFQSPWIPNFPVTCQFNHHSRVTSLRSLVFSVAKSVKADYSIIEKKKPLLFSLLRGKPSSNPKCFVHKGGWFGKTTWLSC